MAFKFRSIKGEATAHYRPKGYNFKQHKLSRHDGYTAKEDSIELRQFGETLFLLPADFAIQLPADHAVRELFLTEVRFNSFKNWVLANLEKPPKAITAPKSLKLKPTGAKPIPGGFDRCYGGKSLLLPHRWTADADYLDKLDSQTLAWYSRFTDHYSAGRWHNDGQDLIQVRTPGSAALQVDAHRRRRSQNILPDGAQLPLDEPGRNPEDALIDWIDEKSRPD